MKFENGVYICGTCGSAWNDESDIDNCMECGKEACDNCCGIEEDYLCADCELENHWDNEE